MKTGALTVVLLLFAFTARSQTPPSTLRLYFPDSLRNALYNLDSVMVDTTKSPVNDSVWIKRGIQSLPSGAVSLRMYDVIGRQVMESRLTANSSQTISFSSVLSSGMYVVSIVSENGTVLATLPAVVR